MSKQLNNKTKRYKKIIDTAEVLFKDNIYDNVQMQDIAEKADIGVATLFRYFPKKQLIIIAVATQILSKEIQFYRELNNQQANGLQKIKAIFKRANRLKSPSRIKDAKFIDIFESNIGKIEDYEVTAEDYFKMRNEISVIISNIVVNGQKDGSLPKVDNLTDEIITIINNYHLFARKLAMSTDIMKLEANIDAEKQLQIMHDIFMSRLKADK